MLRLELTPVNTAQPQPYAISVIRTTDRAIRVRVEDTTPGVKVEHNVYLAPETAKLLATALRQEAKHTNKRSALGMITGTGGHITCASVDRHTNMISFFNETGTAIIRGYLNEDGAFLFAQALDLEAAKKL